MLASTVQFSRYGRQRPQFSASALAGAVPVRGRCILARFLRTQQRAHPASRPGARSAPPKGKRTSRAIPRQLSE
jgi:hypothetical protein